VPVAALAGPDDLAELTRRFHEAHHRRYGHMAQAEAVEIVNFQVTGVGVIPKPPLQQFEHGAAMSPEPAATRQAWFGAGESVALPVFRRDALSPGDTIEGPAVIEEKTSTTILYPGQRAQIDSFLNIDITLDAAGVR
jgi:N-methylhydantoinase A